MKNRITESKHNWRHLTKKDIQMSNKTWNDAQYVISYMQIKTLMWYHYTPNRMSKIQTKNNTKC